MTSTTWSEFFMGIAHWAALRSKDPNTKVGACIVNTNNIVVGIGYNGFPKGCHDNDYPWARSGDTPLDTKYLYVVHAEVNALLNKNASDVVGCTVYVTLFPCNECAKMLIQSGIKRVVYYADKYHDTDACKASRKMFESAGVEYIEYNDKRDNIDNLAKLS